MRFGSVCSGIEAASVAWNSLGWEAAWFAEIEPFPSAVLAQHYPNIPNYGDMTTLVDRIERGEIEAPDMLCGGTPCQAFSVAGQRKSLDDDRGNLSLVFTEIADAIDNARIVQGRGPCIVFWENVPGVLSVKDNAFGCFLAALVGADVPLTPGTTGNKWPSSGHVAGPKRQASWRVLDAQYFGVPQRRRRVFVVASSYAGGIDPSKVLFESPCLPGDSESSCQAREGTAEESEGGSSGTSEVELGSGKPVTPTVVAGYGKFYNDLKDGGCLAVHKGYREGSFGQFVESEQAGTSKASGGVLGGGERNPNCKLFAPSSFANFAEQEQSGPLTTRVGSISGSSQYLVDYESL